MALTTAAAGWWAAALLKLPGARALTANEGRMVYAAVGLTTSVAASVTLIRWFRRLYHENFAEVAGTGAGFVPALGYAVITVAGSLVAGVGCWIVAPVGLCTYLIMQSQPQTPLLSITASSTPAAAAVAVSEHPQQKQQQQQQSLKQQLFDTPLRDSDQLLSHDVWQQHQKT